MLQTQLAKLLNIKYPIIQAPVGSASCPELVAAVSNAGGLGMLALSWRSVDEVRQVICQTKQLTNKPFGVNLVLQWNQEERLKVCIEEGIEIISFFWGDPSPYIEQIHQVGALVMQTVGNSKEAKQAAELGVDIIVAQGWESGGHVWGNVATLPLLPAVVDAVSPLPVIAAGGISDGRGIVAALALGASGVWMGTKFLASNEAFIHTDYREKILKAAEYDTFLSTIFDQGWENAPHRAIRNSTIKQSEISGYPTTGKRPGEGNVVAIGPNGKEIYKYEDFIPLPGMTGDLESLALYAGQSVGIVRKVQSVHDIINELIDEVQQTIGILKKYS